MMKNQSAACTAMAIEVVKRLFGDHPESVISPIKSAGDALIRLEEIFVTIQNEALDGRNGGRIKRMAEDGAHLASCMGKYANQKYAIYHDHLNPGGTVSSEEVPNG